jgi:hypothetical protein
MGAAQSAVLAEAAAGERGRSRGAAARAAAATAAAATAAAAPPVAAPRATTDGAATAAAARPPPDAALGVAAALGGAFSPVNAGPPLPPCEAARAAFAESLDLMDSPSTPELDNILSLLLGMTRTRCALIALFGDRRIWVKAGLNFSEGDFPWRNRWAGWRRGGGG